MTSLRVAATVTLALAGAGCGAVDKRATAPPSPELVHVQVHGLKVTLPPGWQSANRSLTPALADPRKVLAVATYPLRYRRTACAQVAGSALEDLGPDHAFVTLQERGLDPASAWPDFPERPAHFGPTLGGPSDASACVPRAHFSDYWFGFTAGGRHFHADVAVGTRASAETQAQAWAVLDSLVSTRRRSQTGSPAARPASAGLTAHAVLLCASASRTDKQHWSSLRSRREAHGETTRPRPRQLSGWRLPAPCSAR